MYNNLYDKAWFWVLYFGFKGIRGYLVKIRARLSGPVKPLTPLNTETKLSAT
jgi:hypothetical protein